MKRMVAILLVLCIMFAVGCTKRPGAEEGLPQKEQDVTESHPVPEPDGETEQPKVKWELRREKMTQEEMDRIPGEAELVTLRTSLGDIRGIRREGYLEFRGIRYAAAERWQEAEPVTGWEGVYDATRWGDRSLQYFGFYGQVDNLINQFYADEALVSVPAAYSEDSLNLNLWTPEGAEGCPVLVYIHGGAFVTGSNTDASIDGEAYARHGIITVSINYRLGPFANVYGDGYPSNLALKDQLTALRWIRDNIADYGGDPRRITVMGESAGAISVQNLLISPLVEDGLIAGAIMLSAGGSMSAIGSPTYPAIYGMIWNRIKAVQGVEHLSQLANLSDRELFKLWSGQLKELRGLAANPVLDGETLTETVTAALDRNSVKDVPTIIGMLSHDMLPHTLYNAAVEYGSKRAAVGGAPVYLYYFDRIQPGDTTFGAFHAADLYYVFGTLYRNVRPFDDVDYRIAEDMIDYISRFVASGDPNGEGAAVWEPAGVEEQSFLRFGDDPASMMKPDTAELEKIQQTHAAFPYAEKIKP